MIHSRISLHQVAMMGEPTPAFIEHCRSIGVPQMTLATPRLTQPGEMEQSLAELAKGGTQCHTVNYPIAMGTTIDKVGEEETRGLLQAIDMAAALGAPKIYLVSGGRGALLWEEAAERFAALLAPCLEPARQNGVQLLVESASHLNADLHFAHTLDDTIRLAEIAGIGVCIELAACWFEGGLKEKFRRAMPNTGLVQVCDYVSGDRATPNRAVIGDGMIPNEWLIGALLEAGYEGIFDLEMVGPRIEAEGPRIASKRSAENLSELLVKLGA